MMNGPTAADDIREMLQVWSVIEAAVLIVYPNETDGQRYSRACEAMDQALGLQDAAQRERNHQIELMLEEITVPT